MHEAIGKQASMTEHEEYVRSRWELVLDDSGWIRIQIDPQRQECFTGSKERRLSAAYAFTKEREEQIRQVEEEIAILKSAREKIWLGQSWPICNRILAREQAALAELRRGMR